MNLEENFLRGAIDMAISNYESGNGIVPKELGMEYKFEFGLIRQMNNVPNPKSADAVKVTFTWVLAGEQKLIDAETDSYETAEIPMDDYFTIIAGDSLDKLQQYIEEVMDTVTGRN